MAMDDIFTECHTCPLARHISNARAVTEAQISTDLTYIDRSHIIYIGYACGGLGFDVRCLRAIISIPAQRVTIVLIDATYAPLVSVAGADHYITPEECKDVSNSIDDAYHTQLSRLKHLYTYIHELIADLSPDTQVDMYICPSARSWHHLHTQIEPGTTLCTWIDPDTAIAAHQPYRATDAAYLQNTFARRAYDYILTINNDHEPILISSVYAHTITQRHIRTIPRETCEHSIMLAGMHVYPYEPIPDSVQVGHTIHTANTSGYAADAVQLLHALCTHDHLQRICIPGYVRHQLDMLASYSQPG